MEQLDSRGAGHLLTDELCFRIFVSKFCWIWGCALNVFSFTWLFIMESFLRRINFGLLSTSCTEFCNGVRVLWWERELNFYFALIDRQHRGFKTLFFSNAWIFSDLTPLTVSNYFGQASRLCFILTYLIIVSANF